MSKLWPIKNLKIFIVLILVGLIVHYPSFKLSLYGDDWLTIYLYFTHDDPAARFGPLPGILTFLTPYGPSILLIGTLFKIFHTNYIFYYITALILRVIAAFSLYLACQKITNAKFVSFLISVLFLVGSTGLQTTDWVFYMSIYLATGLFLLGIFYKVKFFQERQKKNLYMSLFFELASIIVASVRLYPVIFLSPLTDTLFFFQTGQGKKFSLKLLVIKNIIFVAAITLFWSIGVFGTPGRVYSPDWSVSNFLTIVTGVPIDALKSFFYWVGVTLISLNLIKDVQSIQIIGILFPLFLLSRIIKSLRMVYKRNRVSLLTVSLLFFISLVTIWWYSPLRLISSEDRYLLFPFATLCLLIGVLTSSLAHYLRIGAVILLVFLIVFHSIATRSMYYYWLSKGRDATFIRKVEQIIYPNLTTLSKGRNIIYLNFGDSVTLQSVQFGLAFKILVLSKTWDQRHLALVYNDKQSLIKAINNKITQGEVYAYQFENNTFRDITLATREELLK